MNSVIYWNENGKKKERNSKSIYDCVHPKMRGEVLCVKSDILHDKSFFFSMACQRVFDKLSRVCVQNRESGTM